VARKPNDTVHLKLRFSEALRRRIEREADRNGRSMNAEIIHCVEETYRKADHRADLQLQAKMAATAAVQDTLQIVGFGSPAAKPKGKQGSEEDQS
jgi:hypothetical protein